ncbi:MAG: type IV-A pilus assembly ATPase PilB [Bdellovibrio sp.]|nr:type IV-A pilus assembly ATPase PilB [Bdellovibrio sp.]
MSRQLAELLLKDKFISQKQFDSAVETCKTGGSHIRFLIENRAVAETKLLYYLSQKFGLPSINLAKFEIRPEVLQLLSSDLTRKYQAIPIQANQGKLVVAVYDPTNLSRLDDLKFKTKMTIEPVLTSYTAFDITLNKHYGASTHLGEALKSATKELKEEMKDSTGIELVEVHEIDAQTKAEDAPVISIVNSILSEAITRGASDIHVEPYEKKFRVRMRIDGVLQQMTELPLEMKRAITARFKIMSRMDIAESRIPQDGRIKLRAQGSEIDFRVNSVPTLFGEKIVLRILSKKNLQLDMQKLGFDSKQLELFKKGIYAPNGMVLVTGPTGSGKTTTLYSALSTLNQITDNISTTEDPVEYNLEGINQIQIHKEIGLTFASVLRALLRQDPDIILVGEIRDYETAEIAVQSALTGHLVLSTLHTNDAPSTITRLMNMGLEPFLVVASLNTIIAQRLVRTLCPRCKVEQTVPKEKLIQFGLPENTICYTGKGCPNCNNLGYRGRIAIYEILDFSRTLKEMVLKGATSLELKQQSIQEGMQTLRTSALGKVSEGKTSLEEALAATMES